jgi:hypothetical protein
MIMKKILLGLGVLALSANLSVASAAKDKSAKVDLPEHSVVLKPVGCGTEEHYDKDAGGCIPNKSAAPPTSTSDQKNDGAKADDKK